MQHRWEMAQIECEGREFIRMSDLEMDKTPHFAVDTVRAVQRLYPGAQLYFLVGADRLPFVPGWKDAKELFTRCTLAVHPRVGADAYALCNFLQSHGAQTVLVEGATINLSSAIVRNQIRLLSDAEGMISSALSAYIARNGLYQGFQESQVASSMSERRYVHSRGVRETAIELALIHRLPLQKAAVAAILHDCAKCMELNRLQMIAKRSKLVLQAKAMDSNALLHGPVGAVVATLQYHIHDEDILNAIRYHTTGRRGMSELEMLIFIADAIEPNRRDYPGLSLIRTQAKQDLRLATLSSLLGTRDFVRAKGLPTCELTEEAVKDLMPYYDTKGRKTDDAGRTISFDHGQNPL